MRAARTLPALVLALGVVLGVAACGAGPSTPKVSAAKNQSRVIHAGDEYVAIGDSYTASPYTGTSADAACIRSTNNYPHLVAAALRLSLEDVSCGGATTGSVTSSQTTSTGATKPPQLDAVGSKTALVTVSLGGNDGNVFAAASSACLTYTHTTTGHPCADMDAAGADLASKITTMQHSLSDALSAIIERAPHARVIVIGYPDVMPHQTCAEFPLAAGDAPWAQGINQDLVKAQKQAAKAVGAEYVDVYAATRGHDICSSAPWEAGEQPTAAAAPFHPYAAEQAAVAAALEKQLRGSANP